MRREAIAFLVVASLLLLTTAGARATASKTHFTACEYLTLGTGGKQWTDDAGIQHLRNLPWTSTFTSSLGPGTDYGVISWNLDPATGNGDLFGRFNWAFKNFAPGVTFSGNFNGTFTAGVIHDDWVGHGGGMMVLGHGVSGAASCGGNSFQDGTLLSPHG